MSSLSIAFTAWFLRKHFNHDLDSIIANLNDQTWADFLASDIAVQNNKHIVSQLMPQLVEKKPRKPAAAKKTNASKKTVASQTADSTGNNSEKCENNSPDDKANENEKNEAPDNDHSSQPLDTKSKKPKKIPKSTNQSVEEPVAEEQQPVNISTNNIIMENVGDDILNQPAEKKQKKPKKINNEQNSPVEIVVPIDTPPLDDELYDQTLLTEVFVNDVLFYIDSDNNWYDANTNPCDKQICE